MLVKCFHCQKSFDRIPARVLKCKRHFCSQECRLAVVRKGDDIACFTCGKLFHRKPSQVNRKQKQYCSKKCVATGVDIPCEMCGKVVHREQNQLQNRSHVYCSPECRVAASIKKQSVECSSCKAEIIRPWSEIVDNITGLYFCNMKCKSKYYETKNTVKCLSCGIDFYKGGAEIRRYPLHFCSLPCVNKYYFGESYPEMEFEKMVKPLGIPYERHNRKILHGLELDFYFPTIKFAVEINGRQHYEPIYGNDALMLQKIRDRRKRELCKQLGIHLRTIKPGDCKVETYLPRYQAVVREIRECLKPSPVNDDIFVDG